MKAAISFNEIVESIYSLPLESKEELASLLGNNIADTRRDEILANYQQAKSDQKAGKLKFSNSVKDLKKML